MRKHLLSLSAFLLVWFTAIMLCYYYVDDKLLAMSIPAAVMYWYGLLEARIKAPKPEW